MDWAGRDLKDHLIPCSLTWARTSSPRSGCSVPHIWVELSLDVQWCNWRQFLKAYNRIRPVVILNSSICRYSAFQIILLVFYYIHLRSPLSSGQQTLPLIYSCSQQEDIRIWPVNGEMNISKDFQRNICSSIVGSSGVSGAVLRWLGFLQHEDMSCSLCLMCV